MPQQLNNRCGTRAGSQPPVTRHRNARAHQDRKVGDPLMVQDAISYLAGKSRGKTTGKNRHKDFEESEEDLAEKNRRRVAKLNGGGPSLTWEDWQAIHEKAKLERSRR